MDRKRILFKRKLRYILALLLVFIAAFSVFGLLMYNSAEVALFNDLDSQYREAVALVQENPASSVENFRLGRNIVFTSRGTYAINYKIFILLRDEQGNLLNAEPLRYFEYLFDISYPAQDRYRMVNQQIFRRGTYIHYRTYSFPVEGPDGMQFTVQLATEVTSIVGTLKAIQDTLLRGILITLLVSAAASWALGHMLIHFVSEAWKKQDMFIALASHELRSPLTVVHSSLELLLENPGKRVIDNSKLILNALTETNRMRKVASNLLEMARLESDTQELPRELVDMGEVAHEIAAPFEFQAEESGKIMTVMIQDGLKIYGGRQDLSEMLVLLLENAFKYTEQGDAVELQVQGDEQRVTIKVKDTGIGIENDKLDEIFTRFYRGERARGMAEGSGLGLNIVSNIVKRHSGTIKAAHNMPKGTVFTISLPTALPRPD